MEEFVAPTCIRDYHVYRRIWTVTIGEKLVCKRKISNVVDRYVVGVLKDGAVVGHLSKRLLKSVRCS